MIDFIPPTLEVIRDQRVTTEEVNWYIQELMLVAIIGVMIAGFWKLADKALAEEPRLLPATKEKPLTEAQIAYEREPIPYTPVKRLERGPLYVRKLKVPHPIKGYSESHDEYSVINLRGYRKGYEPRLEILGIYTPNPNDLFRIGTGRLPAYQPIITGDKLQAEMERLGFPHAWRILPEFQAATYKVGDKVIVSVKGHDIPGWVVNTKTTKEHFIRYIIRIGADQYYEASFGELKRAYEPLTLDELKARYEKAPKGVGGYALLKNMNVTWEEIYPLFKEGEGRELRRKGEIMFNIDQWGKIAALRFVKSESGNLPATTERKELCYELAFQFIKREQEGWLVHGRIFGGDPPRWINHAWVETETGFIYEPVEDRFFRKENFYKSLKAQEYNRYTWDRAAVLVLKHKHYGPWSE